MSDRRILYCHCAYSKVISEQVKSEVLERLASSGVGFDAVPDLCEMSARRDPALERLANGDGELRIAACYPRAVRWLFSAAGAALPADGTTICNMRTMAAEDVARDLLTPDSLAAPEGDGGDSASPADTGETNNQTPTPRDDPDES